MADPTTVIQLINSEIMATKNHNQQAVRTVGYIGLGNAGFSMASNIPKRGYRLVVHDADQTKAERAAKEWNNTVAAAGGKPDAFKECDVIITMLPHGKIVREVLLGNDGIAKALRPGTIIVDTSSSSPFDTQALGHDLAPYQLHLLDCPITQTYMHATDAGESTAMVGSDDPAAFARARPILDCMFRYIFHMGALGSGHAMKSFNNYIMAASIHALCDSLVAGAKGEFALDPAQMVEVLNVGTGVCFPTLDTFRRDGITRRWESGFGLALLVKDLGIAEEVMRRSRVETELPVLLRGALQESLDQVEATADHTKCLVGWENRAGVKLKTVEKVTDIAKDDFEHRLNGLNRPS